MRKNKQPSKLKKRVAVIPVVRKKKRHYVCMVTSREHNTWIIPTGKLEKKLSIKKVALLEAFEESGSLGKLDKSFYKEVKLASPGGAKKRKIYLFVLHVDTLLARWPEKNQRNRKLVKASKYIKTLPTKKLKKSIKNCVLH